MESFKKLKQSFFPCRYDIVKDGIKFGEIVDNEFKGIQYSILNPDYRLLKVIPKKYQNDFCVNLMRINREIPPHTDTGIKVTINFYYKTENCITQFYNFNGEPRKYQIENQVDGYIYDESDLKKTDSFIAKNYEAWILDVTKPHSVKPFSGIKERVAITLATFTHSYEDVCNMLIETGHL